MMSEFPQPVVRVHPPLSGHLNTPTPTRSVLTRDLLELIHDPALVIDPYSYEILAANRCACLTYLSQESGLEGKSADVYWKDVESESRMLAKVVRDGSSHRYDTIHISSSGTDMVVRSNAGLIEFEGRTAIVTSNLDIGERETTQQSITKANIEWRNTVDSVADLIIMEDESGAVRRCNRAAAAFFGMDFVEVIGSPLSELLIPTEGFSTGHMRLPVWEGQFEKISGWFEIKNHPVRSNDGIGNVWVHVIKDITASRQAKQELLKLYSVMEQSSDATVISDTKGRIQYLNKRAEILFAGNQRKLIGQSLFDIKSGLSAELFAHAIVPILQNEPFWRATNRIEESTENIFEEVTVSRVLDADGRPANYVFTIRDVTETRQLESIAEAVSLMENVGYVFSGIRHELGNPINSVKMALTVLEKNYQKWDDEQVNLFISRCLHELGRVEYLLKTLKNFSLHENLDIEETDITDFLQRSHSYASSDFESRGIEISFHGSPGIKATCDPRALHQVMINLMANAADALEDTDEPKIIVNAAEVRNRIHLTVEDNGKGMTEKQMENLFKPFYTSKSGGTGLGLVIVQKMLVNMGGTINIESEYGEGTKVTIALKGTR